MIAFSGVSWILPVVEYITRIYPHGLCFIVFCYVFMMVKFTHILHGYHTDSVATPGMWINRSINNWELLV